MYSMLREDYLTTKTSDNMSKSISDHKIIEIISRVLENENISITIPTAIAVLIIKVFLSSIAALISFAFSVIAR